MKSLLRYFLINLTALWITTEVIHGFSYSGGFKTLIVGSALFACINLLLVPLLKILFLPLNLLTLGLFTWLINVLAIFALTQFIPQFKLTSFYFPGLTYNGFVVPGTYLTVFWVAVAASFVIGLVTHFMHWLMH